MRTHSDLNGSASFFLQGTGRKKQGENTLFFSGGTGLFIRLLATLTHSEVSQVKVILVERSRRKRVVREGSRSRIRGEAKPVRKRITDRRRMCGGDGGGSREEREYKNIKRRRKRGNGKSCALYFLNADKRKSKQKSLLRWVFLESPEKPLGIRQKHKEKVI